jgi:hypothetical protein
MSFYASIRHKTPLFRGQQNSAKDDSRIHAIYQSCHKQMNISLNLCFCKDFPRPCEEAAFFAKLSDLHQINTKIQIITKKGRLHDG